MTTEYKNNDIFRGTIVTQDLVMSEGKENQPSVPSLRLGVRLTHFLPDGRNPNRVTELAEPLEVSTQIFMDPDLQKVETWAESLLAMGFEGDSPEEFHTGHANFAARGNLIGKTCHLRAWVKDNGSTVWQPKLLSTGIPASEADLKALTREVSGALKNALAKRRGQARATSKVPY